MLPSVSTFDDFLYALSPRDSFKFSCTVGSEQLIQAWVLENATSSSQTGRYNFDINSPLNDEGETCLHLVLKALHVDHNRDGSKMLFNYTIDSEEVLAEVERRTALGEEEQIYTIYIHYNFNIYNNPTINIHTRNDNKNEILCGNEE